MNISNYFFSGEKESEKASTPANNHLKIPLVPIIGSLLAVLIVVIILIDVSCYKLNETGKTFYIMAQNMKTCFRFHKLLV